MLEMSELRFAGIIQTKIIDPTVFVIESNDGERNESSSQSRTEEKRDTFRWWATWRVDVDRSRTLSHGSRGQVDKSPFPGRTSREKRERKIGSEQSEQRIQRPSSLPLPLPPSLSFYSLARSLARSSTGSPFDPKKIQIARPIPVTIPERTPRIGHGIT